MDIILIILYVLLTIVYLLVGIFIAGCTFPDPRCPRRRFWIRVFVWLPALLFGGIFERLFDGR